MTSYSPCKYDKWHNKNGTNKIKIKINDITYSPTPTVSVHITPYIDRIQGYTVIIGVDEIPTTSIITLLHNIMAVSRLGIHQPYNQKNTQMVMVSKLLSKNS